MKTALLLIEFQNDYFPEGRMPIERSMYAAANAKEILQAFRAREWPIVHIQHLATRPNDNYFLPCTKGMEFYQELQPRHSEYIIKKNYPNSFRDSNLNKLLRQLAVNQLVCCGMMTHQAVDATIKAAYDQGFTCAVLRDACATKDLTMHDSIIFAKNVHNAFLAALEPIYATVLDTDTLLAGMAGARITQASTVTTCLV